MHKILNHKRKLITGTLIALIFSVFIARGPDSSPDLSALLPISDFESVETYRNLPVGKVEVHKVSDSRGTVILIPQYHKYPGSESEDQVNDSAKIAQEQIYEILHFLTTQGEVKFVMAEGALYGPIARTKIQDMQERLTQYDQLVRVTAGLRAELGSGSVDPKLEKQLLQNLDLTIAAQHRDIMLRGAALVLIAKSDRFSLVGSENEDTLQKSRELVRDHVYLQDRLRELKNTTARSSKRSDTLLNTQNLKILQKLLGRQNNADKQAAALQRKAKAQGRQNLAALLDTCAELLEKLKQPTDNANQPVSGSARADNPYQSITSQKKLQKMLNESEQQIASLVVDQRNRETAANVARALAETSQQIGVLQFGAAHESGLVKELQNQGLSVIVVTPREVDSRNSSPQ